MLASRCLRTSGDIYERSIPLVTLLIYPWPRAKLILFLTFHLQTNSPGLGRLGPRAAFAQEGRAGEEEKPPSPALWGNHPPHTL